MFVANVLASDVAQCAHIYQGCRATTYMRRIVVVCLDCHLAARGLPDLENALFCRYHDIVSALVIETIDCLLERDLLISQRREGRVNHTRFSTLDASRAECKIPYFNPANSNYTVQGNA